MGRSPLKILGVIDEEPFDFRTWSGTSRYFFDAIKQSGYLYQAVSAMPSPWVTRLYQAASFQPDMASWRFRYHLHTGTHRQRTRVVQKKMRKMDPDGYNAILQVGAWYDFTGTKDKVTASYHDGNLATRLASPYGHPQLARRHLDRALAYERCLYDRMDAIFPMSRWLADSFIRDFGVDASKLHPVGAGINLPQVADVGARTYERPEILFVGRDFKRKGGDTLLEAFRTVRRELPDAQLTLIGPALSGLPDGVRCEGFVSKDTPDGLNRLLAAYTRASIFVLPSLYEPFGIALAEAMAHKLPCIAADNCAMPEIVDDGATGYVVPMADSAALARRMLALLKDAGQCRQMGEAGHARYLAQFTWDRVTGRITDVLASIAR